MPREAPARAVGSDAYAVLRVPRLGLVVPVAQGIDKRGVLDKGYAGHYPGTAAPGAPGNFALAGHRNTHGEPFRYVNRLRAGDELIVDVRGQRFVYAVDKTLAQTTERDTGVIAPVPRSLVKPDAGYGEPGAYITLTTCTPEYSSRYRLVVWGTLKSRLPTRSVGGGAVRIGAEQDRARVRVEGGGTDGRAARFAVFREFPAIPGPSWLPSSFRCSCSAGSSGWSWGRAGWPPPWPSSPPPSPWARPLWRPVSYGPCRRTEYAPRSVIASSARPSCRSAIPTPRAGPGRGHPVVSS
ncbi:hypothetical protein GCM10020254_53230 [Streptomyces goshikiensis]